MRKVIVLILAGGTGTRLGSDTPKQYIEVAGKPIIGYCLDGVQHYQGIDHLVIVCSAEWEDYISAYIKENGINKFAGFAAGGKSRQHSVVNGLNKIRERGFSDDDIVITHDAARPSCPDGIFDRIIASVGEYDGTMPYLTVKDTVYTSENGQVITGLLNRDLLFAGQTPEAFHFGKYYEANMRMNDEQLSRLRGTSEVAVKSGMRIQLVEGDERNYKITTQQDLEKFILQTESRGK